VVVDQTLHSLAIEDEKVKYAFNCVGTVKEKINVEISVSDGELNKILADLDVELKYKYNNDATKSEKFKTDKEGKFIFTTTQSGFVYLQLFTNDFSINSKYLSIRYGKNEYSAKLYKGGSLEVRATNAENKVVEGLTAKLGGVSRFRQTQDSLPMVLDAARGIYTLSNLPVGTQDVSFKAIGYQESPSYKIRVEAKGNSLLEVKLNASRTIFFDLAISTKPDLIFVSNRKIIRSRGRNNVPTENLVVNNETGNSRQGNRQVNRQGGFSGGAQNQISTGVIGANGEKTEAFKNANGLYEFELEDRNTTGLTLYVDKYIPQDVNLVPEKDTYKLTLTEGYAGELLVTDEKGVVVVGASVNYAAGVFKQIAVSGEDGVALLTGLNEKMVLRLNVTHKDFVVFNDSWSFDSIEQNSKKIALVEAKGISGKIKFGDKVVMGAKVQLFISGNNNAIAKMDSDGEGTYFFNNLEDKKDKDYTLKAFHRDYGTAVSSTVKFENKAQVVDLTLIEEKSLGIKLVD
jgi:hypothetical protein